jgi:hypothetical protein
MGDALLAMSSNVLDRIDTTRRRALNGLNRRYIYGRLVCFVYSIATPLFFLVLLTICFHNDIASVAHTPISHRDGGYHEASGQIQLILCRQAR